jgi:hypothetical protein
MEGGSMDIRPTDLPISQPREVDVIRRVDAASDRQGQRQPQGREADDESRPQDDAPHDLVDVSAQYEATLHVLNDGEGGPPVSPDDDPAESGAPQLDIEA